MGRGPAPCPHGTYHVRFIDPEEAPPGLPGGAILGVCDNPGCGAVAVLDPHLHPDDPRAEPLVWELPE